MLACITRTFVLALTVVATGCLVATGYALIAHAQEGNADGSRQASLHESRLQTPAAATG